MKRTLQARLIARRGELVGNDVLLQVTSGPRGAIVALAANEHPFRPNSSPPFFRYTISCLIQGAVRTLRLDGVALRISLVQPLDEDTFLLVSPLQMRSGDPNNALIARIDGLVLERFTLPSGIADVQIDSAGQTWVGFSDEGAFRGHGLSREGVIRMTPDRQVTLRFTQRALELGVPLMYNCNALNVADGGAAYFYYYGESAAADFPLVEVRDNDVVHTWRVRQVKGARAFAIDGNHVLFAGMYGQPDRLTLLDLATGALDDVTAVDEDGQPLVTAPTEGGRPPSPRRAWGRGNVLYLLDDRGVWAVTVP